MKCIIKADDFGLSEGVNLGVMKSFLSGPVRNAGVMVNMAAAKEAFRLADPYPELCLGLHVNISIGRPVTDPGKLRGMTDETGNFHSSAYCRQMLASGRDPVEDYGEALTEVEAQILRFKELCGRLPDYMDGHAIHSHNVFLAMSHLAEKYRILHYSYENGRSYGIRVEPFRGKPPYPFYEEGREPQEYFTKDCCKILGQEYAMLFMHPGYVDYALYGLTSYIKVRTQDLEALIHPDTARWFQDNHIETITYKTIRK